MVGDLMTFNLFIHDQDAVEFVIGHDVEDVCLCGVYVLFPVDIIFNKDQPLRRA